MRNSVVGAPISHAKNSAYTAAKAEAASEGISILPQIDTAARYTPQVKRPPTGAANRYRPRSRNTRQKPSAPVKDVTSCVIISQFLPSARRRS